MMTAVESDLRNTYDKELAESFLFPESNHSEHRCLYIGTRHTELYPAKSENSAMTTSITNHDHNNNSLMKNVACFARFLKKAEEKGICLEQILDDDTADTPISFLSEAPGTHSFDEVVTKSESTGISIASSYPPINITTGSQESLSIEHFLKGAKGMGETCKSDVPSSKNDHDERTVASLNALIISTAMFNHCSGNTVSFTVKEEQQTISYPPPLSTRDDRLKKTAKISRSKSENHVSSKSKSRRTSRILRCRSESDFAESSHPQFLDLLDPPPTSPMLPLTSRGGCGDSKTEITPAARRRSLVRAYHSPLKKILHATIKERKWLNLQVLVAKHACRGMDVMSLLHEASIQPYNFETVTRDDVCEPNTGTTTYP